MNMEKRIILTYTKYFLFSFGEKKPQKKRVTSLRKDDGFVLRNARERELFFKNIRIQIEKKNLT